MRNVLMLGVTLMVSLSCAFAAPEKLSIATIFGNDMVLQRDKDVPVWGWAPAGEAVTVEFAGQKVAATAAEDGKWVAMLKPLKANAEAADLTITGSSTITLKNVLVGDVWICSGQSNMEWSVGRSMNANEEAKVADHPLIRHIKVSHQPSSQPLASFRGKWQVCSPKTVKGFTAVGYYFGRRLHKELNIPIGLVNSSWGGTRIEPWTPQLGFEMIKDQKFSEKILNRLRAADPATEAGKASYGRVLAEIEKWTPAAKEMVAAGKFPPAMPAFPSIGTSHQDPTRLYRGMIHPLAPLAVRGAIWYQGESNGGEYMSYYHKKHALVKGWRKVFGQDFPFYWVQLANYRSDRKQPAGGDGYARIREGQRLALDIPKTGMAVIIDIGDTRDIHPRNKQDVGSRLAQWALAKEYGKDVVPSGPFYKSFAIEGDKIRISFDNVGGGLIVGSKKGLEATQEVADGKLERFAIAGEDKKWVWADAVIDGNTVVVSSKDVPKPVAVRYAYSGNPLGANLYNKEGLPATPFRTDDWSK